MSNNSSAEHSTSKTVKVFNFINNQRKEKERRRRKKREEGSVK